MGPEGALRVGLRVEGGRVAGVRLSSSRPDIAGQLLSGRSRAEAAALVPRLFSVCAQSQSVASALACAAAALEPVDAQRLARARRTVAAETLRELALRTLLQWPKALGETPAEDCVAAARGTLGAVAGASSDAVALAAFGRPAAQWLALQTLPELQHWAAQGQSAAARFVRQVLDAEAADGAPPSPGAGTVALLPSPLAPADLAELAGAAAAQRRFSRRPVWRGLPAETGALARQQRNALLQALLQRGHGRLAARAVARLRELALLLAGRGDVALGAATLADGSGLGWVENARGLLMHRLQLVQGRTAGYRIVAPTEWNFHPDGALPVALRDRPAHDLDALRQRARLLVDSLDPCVACSVEIEDA